MSIALSQFAQNSTAQLYLGFFGRAPDAAGFTYWSERISQGLSPLEVAKGFEQSPEFSLKYSGLSAADQVQLVYNNILERSPDPAGAQYWTEMLEAGSSIGQIVWSVVNSAFTQEGTRDGLLVQGKVQSAQNLISPVVLDIPTSNWSATSGFGVINVSAALSSILGVEIEQGASFKTSVEQWPIPVTHFAEAWSLGYAGKGVCVAVIDTGLDLNNPALNHNVSTLSWNFVLNNANIQDDNGHGTAVTSIITSGPNEQNSSVLLGGAYEAEIMVLKAVDEKGIGSEANLVAAINYAVDHGADVINLSLGGASGQKILEALSHAADHGVIVCMAAGNTGSSLPQYPAAYAQLSETTIAVGSVMQTVNGSVVWAPSSNSAGTTVPYNYVDAPGARVLAYGLNNEVQTWSGTSFATPLVTAAVANLLSINSGLGAEEIVNAIVNTAVDLVGIQQPI